jgi:hypothetical protein
LIDFNKFSQIHIQKLNRKKIGEIQQTTTLILRASGTQGEYGSERGAKMRQPIGAIVYHYFKSKC